ncbi:MAG: carbon-nitrogen family hydrolase, partial [Methanosarcinales archaeon]|nr:carbon-nitrogen family hydrolase [Methanosarcinales archaeon]
MKVACIQMDVKNCDNTTGVADIKGMNLQKAMDHIHDAVDKGAELIVLPEVFSTGFCYDSMDEYAETAPWPTVTALCDEFGNDDVCIIGSFIEGTDGGAGEAGEDRGHSDGKNGTYFNTGFCIDKGEVAGVYRKCHPFGREKDIFTKGSDISPIPTSKGVIGLEICYELR